MSQLREVRLYGELGRRFGRVHRLAVESVGEAVRALCVTLHGFERALRDHPHGFHVLAGRDDRATGDGLALPVSGREVIKLVPATAGSKNGILTTILGIALIALTIWNPLGLFAGEFAALAFSGKVGVALVLGGVAQMLAPKIDYSAGTDEETKQSYVFNGAVNTTNQGACVPIGYGELIVGSHTISTGLSVQEL